MLLQFFAKYHFTRLILLLFSFRYPLQIQHNHILPKSLIKSSFIDLISKTFLWKDSQPFQLLLNRFLKSKNRINRFILIWGSHQLRKLLNQSLMWLRLQFYPICGAYKFESLLHKERQQIKLFFFVKDSSLHIIFVHQQQLIEPESFWLFILNFFKPINEPFFYFLLWLFFFFIRFFLWLSVIDHQIRREV